MTNRDSGVVISDVPVVPKPSPCLTLKVESDMKPIRILTILTILLIVPRPTRSDDDLVIVRYGTLPIIISAPHGGSLSLPGVDARNGEGQTKGASGFRTARDTGTEELALLIARITGFGGGLVFDPAKPDGTPRKLLDVSQLHALGWHARISLQEGIRQTYAWYCSQT